LLAMLKLSSTNEPAKAKPCDQLQRLH